MIRPVNPTERFGLVGVGVSGAWEATLSESPENSENDFLLELTGPTTHLSVRIDGLARVADLHRLLADRSVPSTTNSRQTPEIELQRGIKILADNEEVPRRFLMVRTDADAMVRVTLNPSDLECLAEAVEQMLHEVSEDREEPAPAHASHET